MAAGGMCSSELHAAECMRARTASISRQALRPVGVMCAISRPWCWTMRHKRLSANDRSVKWEIIGIDGCALTTQPDETCSRLLLASCSSAST